jgi:cobalamin-dependent methionine synthase I
MCDQSIWFVATLGKKFDQKVKKLMKKHKYMDAYLLDTLGSIGIENLVNSFHHEFESYFEEFDRGVTLRFSPGYCDWDLEEQRTVFELVDTEDIGVDLTESCLMVPSKSVSGVFGVTEEPCKSVTNSNPCLRCGKKDCNMRREVLNGSN